jgi:hypothetical protein
MRRCSLPLLVCLLLSACGGKSRPPDPAVDAAQAERHSEQTGAPEYRSQAKRAAEECMKQYRPDWVIEGEAVYQSTGIYYVVYIDASHDKDRQTLEFDVQRFAKPDGTFYWKASHTKQKTDAEADAFSIYQFTPAEESEP